jgi:hypothetical protein
MSGKRSPSVKLGSFLVFLDNVDIIIDSILTLTEKKICRDNALATYG